MARKYNDRYVRYYTFGSTAARLEEQERKASLPKYKEPEKRKPIPFDPVAFAGCAVAVLLAVLMVVGMLQVAHTAAQVRELKTQIVGLEQEQQMLQERYESGYDLNEVRVAAVAMGMISQEDAVRVPVEVSEQLREASPMDWWESILMSLREFLA